MLIGELGQRTGASPKAIRLYEARGLLSRVDRQGAFRFYTGQHLQQVRLIRQAQALGFSLAEFGASAANAQGEPDWDKVLQQLAVKRASVRKDIQMLELLEARIEQVEDELRTCLKTTWSADVELCDDLISAAPLQRVPRRLDSAPRDKA